MYQCWVMVVLFHNILSFITELKVYQMLPCPYVGSYSGEKGRQFLQEDWIIALAISIETFVMVLISDMPNKKYWHNLVIVNAVLVIHVLCYWQLLEGNYTQDIQKILIVYTKTLMVLCQ